MGRRYKGRSPVLAEVNLSPGEWDVIRLALETQERVMTGRGAHPAAEAAYNVRRKLDAPEARAIRNLRRNGHL